MSSGSTKAIEILAAAALGAFFSGLGFYLVESREHVHRSELDDHVTTMIPIIRQMDENRGAVTARLAAIDYRLAELSELVRELRRQR